MTAVYEKVPADFWSRGPNYPCLGLVHPEVLFLELPLRTYSLPRMRGAFVSRDLQKRNYQMDESPLPLLKTTLSHH